jgi:hypothetical protein
MSKPYAVVFSGVPGSSKSIVAEALSYKFSLPIFSTDNLRFEIQEDLLSRSINREDCAEEYKRRYASRIAEILSSNRPFIRDGSVDRTWPDVKSRLQAANYDWFMVGMELSRDFMESLYMATGRPIAAQQLPVYIAQHNTFMADYSSDVDIMVTDETFHVRREIAVAGLERYLSTEHPVAIAQ